MQRGLPFAIRYTFNLLFSRLGAAHSLYTIDIMSSILELHPTEWGLVTHFSTGCKQPSSVTRCTWVAAILAFAYAVGRREQIPTVVDLLRMLGEDDPAQQETQHAHVYLLSYIIANPTVREPTKDEAELLIAKLFQSSRGRSRTFNLSSSRRRMRLLGTESFVSASAICFSVTPIRVASSALDQ